MNVLSARLARRWHAAVLLFILAFIAPTVAHADAGVLVVGTDQRVIGDIATVAQPIEIAGAVTGDVTSWTGDISITGSVSGDVVSYVGTVTIGAGAQVGGSVMSVGGAVDRHALAQVSRAEIGGSKNAALTSLAGLMLPQTDSAAPAAFGSAVLGIVGALLLCAFALLWGAFWPNRTLASALMLRVFPFRALVIGLLTTLALVLLAPPLFGLLAASLLGLPLLVVALVIVNLPYVYGLAATARYVALAQRQPMFQAAPSMATLLLIAAVAVAVALAASITPLGGLLTFYLLASPGLGAVLLSRGGLLAPVT